MGLERCLSLLHAVYLCAYADDGMRQAIVVMTVSDQRHTVSGFGDFHPFLPMEVIFARRCFFLFVFC